MIMMLGKFMKKYKVFYGSFSGESIVGDNLTLNAAQKLSDEYLYDLPYQSPRIEEYEEFDIREDRRLKLEKLKNL